MAVSHRTNRLKVIGNPSVEKLQNDRFRLTFNMSPLNPRNDWYNDNKGRIFAEFGTLESAAMSVDGIDARFGEAYSDMRLIAVEAGNRSAVEGGDYIVQFVYETLGADFVQIKDDTIDYEVNGLRRLRRESIAQAGTDFQKTVGETEITSQIDDETAVTLYLASYEVDDTDSYRKVTEVYLEAGVVSFDEDRDSGGNIITVQAFKFEDADIRTNSPVDSDHVLIQEDVRNQEGFPTRVYTYEKGSYDIVDFELNGLRRTRRTTVTTGSVSTGNIGETTKSGLGNREFLAEVTVDKDGPINRRVETFIEEGKLSESKVSQSEGVYRVTTTFLAGNNFDVASNTTGPIIAQTNDDIEGYETITVVTLQNSDGDSIVRDNVVSHNLLSPFTYPGVVELEAETLGSGPDRVSFVARDFRLTPPCEALVPAAMKISFRTDSSIVYSSADGLWNPTSWAKGQAKGIGWSYSPFSVTKSFRGYRAIGASVEDIGGDNPYSMVHGKRIYNNTRFTISCEGGPVNPVGGEYTLNYDVSLAFEDVDGNKYYKHREIVSTIPSQV